MNWRGLIYKLLFGGGIIFDLSKWVIITAVAVIIVNSFFYSIFVVDGHSMEPNYRNRELVFWDKAVYKKQDPKRLDVIVMAYPGNTKYRYVKRIIGLPGETITIKDSKVYVDGKILKEPYIPKNYQTEPDATWELREGEYFAMGDNRPGSNDCRIFGPVEKRFILGKSLAIIFPRFTTAESIK